MHGFRRFLTLRLSVLAVLVLSLVPLPTAAQATSYTSDEYGFTVTWPENWSFHEDYSGPDTVSLDLEQTIYVSVIAMPGADASPAEAIQPSPSDTVIDDRLNANPPSVSWEDSDGYFNMAEAYSINDGEVTIIVLVSTIPVLSEDAVEAVQQGIQVNGSPVLVGEPIADGTMTSGTTRTTRTTETPTATETSGGAVRTTRTSTETPVATETTGATRSTRTSRTATETPTATEAPATGLESFTGPVYGYTLQFDPTVWTVDTEIEDEGVDGIRLVSDTATFTVWAWNAYGSDPLVCLNSEVEYYGNGSEQISEWANATGADGAPLRFESPELAWGVYSLVYTNDAGEAYPLIDYISCEPIPGQDAVLIVLLSSDPDAYNDNLDLALDVLDTIQFGDAPADPTAPSTPDASTGSNSTGANAGQEISTSLDGSFYTSPNFGYTVEIPLEWRILDETNDGVNETLVVGNGTSVVTLWGTSDYRGDLAGCVDYAANASGLDLELDTDASGDAFRGSYGNEAFANFVYDNNGVQMTFFVHCQPIEGTDGFLILTQDVPYDEFTNERRFRSEIEDSITMP